MIRCDETLVDNGYLGFCWVGSRELGVKRETERLGRREAGGCKKEG